MHVTCKCGEEFVAKTIDCPQGKIGCCVAHWDTKSFICPNCERNTWLDIKDLPWEIEEGISIFNPEAVAKLELK